MAGDEFAELLRELKERSGLSYGVLAKRLHVSTSTLHRYVNGDAVPTDYAPVERLARACRATPEELVDLHRRWVLADALRGQKGTPPGAPARAGGTPDGGAVPAVDAAVDAAVLTGRAGGTGRDEGAGEDGDAGAVRDEGAGEDGDAVTVADVRGESGPGSLPGAGPETGDRVPARWNRRTVALAAAGAVVAAAVASTALVVHLGSGGSEDDAKGHLVRRRGGSPFPGPALDRRRTPPT
ncbi:helix-turn-helix domain-containing protein, partial [Streptomyces sp. NPDC003483]